MGFRFYKRIKLLPGVNLNLSKSGPSFSFGPRGMKYTIGPKGTRTTFGIPGTGIYYTKSHGAKQKTNQADTSDRFHVNLNVGFLKSVFASDSEKNIIEGLKYFAAEDIESALLAFQRNQQDADSLFMIGYLLLGKGMYQQAELSFEKCLSRLSDLGGIINKYSNDFELLLEVTNFIEAPIKLDSRGLSLCLIEVLQKQKKYQAAIKVATEIWNANPSDEVVLLSLSEIIVYADSPSQADLKEIVTITQDIENADPIHSNILFLKGYALYRLGIPSEAAKIFTLAMKKTQNRPESLLLQIKYCRGLVYQSIGQLSKAKSDYSSVYSVSPNFADVSKRLSSL